jgi:hypothetical protein
MMTNTCQYDKFAFSRTNFVSLHIYNNIKYSEFTYHNNIIEFKCKNINKNLHNMLIVEFYIGKIHSNIKADGAENVV